VWSSWQRWYSKPKKQVAVNEAITACRDAKDDKFLELAVSGKASHIVSGDADLLVLHPFRSIAILTPQAFLANLLGSGAEQSAPADRPRD